MTYEQQIKNIKRNIIKKKILLNFIIKTYGTYAKIVRYIVLIISTLAVVLSTLASIFEGTRIFSIINIVITILVLVGAELKSKIKYGQIKTLAKDQYLKYTQLMMDINNESLKQNRMQSDEFFYWTTKELLDIEKDNPSLSSSDDLAYKAYCIQNNIPYNEDIDELKALLEESDILTNNNVALNIDDTKTVKNENIVLSEKPIITNSVPLNHISYKEKAEKDKKNRKSLNKMRADFDLESDAANIHKKATLNRLDSI